ncbi:unnamed protein product [Choristocarpus tenellus]
MSSRKTRLASDKYNNNVHKRGVVPKGKIDSKKNGYSVGPCLLVFFVFVIVGSSVFAILKVGLYSYALLQMLLHCSSLASEICHLYRCHDSANPLSFPQCPVPAICMLSFQ